MKRPLVLGAALLVIATVAVAWVFAVPALPERKGGLPTARVTRGPLALNVHATGELRDGRTVTMVTPPVGGMLRIVQLVPTGGAVKAGDVVMEFDPADQLYNLEQARTDLAEAQQEIVKMKADRDVQYATHEVHRAMGERETRTRDGFTFARSDEDTLAAAREFAEQDAEADDAWRVRAVRRALERYDEAENVMAGLREKWSHHDEEYTRRGGWRRAFLATSSDGHVHSTRHCPTCNKGRTLTSFQLMTDYSGKDEPEIVADAGWRACTVCFPSAPVGDPRSLPTKMFSTEEQEKATARAEREEKRAQAARDRIAKGLTADGSPLRVDWTETNAPGWDPVPGGRPGETKHVYRDRPEHQVFKTERAAVQWYVETLAFGLRAADKAPALEAIAKAIAVKRGVDVEKVKAELERKVKAKKRRP